MERLSGYAYMLKLQVRGWSEGPRILVLMLAVMLPAAGLIVFGGYYLRHLQRDKIIEAVFQRDHRQVLAIAEKRIDERAYDIAEEASAKFPDVDNADEIDAFLTVHPDIAHAFLWTGKGSIEFRSQASQMQNSQLCAESRMLSSDFGTWWDMDGEDTIAKLKRIEATEGRHVYITDHWLIRGDKMLYQSLVLFLPRGSTPEHPALAGFLYDTDYLKNKFFPKALNEALPSQNESERSNPQTAIMVRTEKDQYPLATSAYWDGGSPEVERSFENVFPGLVLGIKLRGTTIADISDHILRISFLVLGALSLLMGG